MARIRTIKPEIWTDEKFGPLDPLTKLVFIGLISQADDGGRLLDSVRLIVGLLFPYEDSTKPRRSLDEDSSNVRRALDELSRTGLIQRGTTKSGQKVIQIAKWEEHQKIDRPNMEAALPPICNDDNDIQDFDEESSKDRRSLDEDSSARSTTNDQRSTTGEQRAPDPTDAVRGIYGWEGSEGTDPVLMKAFPDSIEERDRCLRIAWGRLQAEGKQYHGRLFRRILEAVIDEQSDDNEGGWLYDDEVA